jgi:pimeloyl-ACP methyl ester carboxylesterase
MRDLINLCEIDRVTVIGHSLGGGVAMQFAYQYPELCERLVLVATGGIGREVHPLLRCAASPNADLILPLLRSRTMRLAGHGVLSALRWLKTDIGRDADDLDRLFEALPDQAARRAFVRTLRAVVDWRGQVITMLDRCYLMRGIPTLLVWGERDGVIPFAHARLLEAAMPSARLEVFAGAGHFPHHFDTVRFVAVLLEFLATTAPARHSVAEWRALLRRGRPGVESAAPSPSPPRASRAS